MRAVTRLASLFARTAPDARCATHGVQPQTYSGCMKCGAGSVAKHSARDAARASTAELVSPAAEAWRDDGNADGDDDGWDAGW
ncbi:MAG: hypothetical protein QG597_1237 [Actinomycetota bacterium]|nr:hypothetical protein [Actinomycetota bacterium]